MRPHLVLNWKPLYLPILIAIAGCGQMPEVPTMVSPYRIDIQQGNVVTQEMVDKLKPGMTRSQVRFALGSPLIVDPFRTDRWDYVYTYQKQGRKVEHRRIIVIFQDDKLLRVEGDVVPQTAAQQKPQPSPPSSPAAPAAKPEAARPGEAAPKGTATSGPAESETSNDKDAPAQEKGFFGRMLERIGL